MKDDTVVSRALTFVQQFMSKVYYVCKGPPSETRDTFFALRQNDIVHFEYNPVELIFTAKHVFSLPPLAINPTKLFYNNDVLTFSCEHGTIAAMNFNTHEIIKCEKRCGAILACFQNNDQTITRLESGENLVTYDNTTLNILWEKNVSIPNYTLYNVFPFMNSFILCYTNQPLNEPLHASQSQGGVNRSSSHEEAPRVPSEDASNDNSEDTSQKSKESGDDSGLLFMLYARSKDQMKDMPLKCLKARITSYSPFSQTSVGILAEDNSLYALSYTTNYRLSRIVTKPHSITRLIPFTDNVILCIPISSDSFLVSPPPTKQFLTFKANIGQISLNLSAPPSQLPVMMTYANSSATHRIGFLRQGNQAILNGTTELPENCYGLFSVDIYQRRIIIVNYENSSKVLEFIQTENAEQKKMQMLQSTRIYGFSEHVRTVGFSVLYANHNYLVHACQEGVSLIQIDGTGHEVPNVDPKPVAGDLTNISLFASTNKQIIVCTNKRKLHYFEVLQSDAKKLDSHIIDLDADATAIAFSGKRPIRNKIQLNRREQAKEQEQPKLKIANKAEKKEGEEEEEEEKKENNEKDSQLPPPVIQTELGDSYSETFVVGVTDPSRKHRLLFYQAEPFENSVKAEMAVMDRVVSIQSLTHFHFCVGLENGVLVIINYVKGAQAAQMVNTVQIGFGPVRITQIERNVLLATNTRTWKISLNRRGIVKLFPLAIHSLSFVAELTQKFFLAVVGKTMQLVSDDKTSELYFSRLEIQEHIVKICSVIDSTVIFIATRKIIKITDLRGSDVNIDLRDSKEYCSHDETIHTIDVIESRPPLSSNTPPVPHQTMTSSQSSHNLLQQQQLTQQALNRQQLLQAQMISRPVTPQATLGSPAAVQQAMQRPPLAPVQAPKATAAVPQAMQRPPLSPVQPPRAAPPNTAQVLAAAQMKQSVAQHGLIPSSASTSSLAAMQAANAIAQNRLQMAQHQTQSQAAQRVNQANAAVAQSTLDQREATVTLIVIIHKNNEKTIVRLHKMQKPLSHIIKFVDFHEFVFDGIFLHGVVVSPNGTNAKEQILVLADKTTLYAFAFSSTSNEAELVAKFENVGAGIRELRVKDSSIFVGDSRNSTIIVEFNAASKEFAVLSRDKSCRTVTALKPCSQHSVCGGDLNGNVFVFQIPQVPFEQNFTEKEQPMKVLLNYNVGSTVTGVEYSSNLMNCVWYSTISGGFGGLLSFPEIIRFAESSKELQNEWIKLTGEKLAFLKTIEQKVAWTFASLTNCNAFDFHNKQFPSSGVIDLDIVEMFFVLNPEKQEKILSSLQTKSQKPFSVQQFGEILNQFKNYFWNWTNRK